jgi:hypothetical protein
LLAAGFAATVAPRFRTSGHPGLRTRASHRPFPPAQE